MRVFQFIAITGIPIGFALIQGQLNSESIQPKGNSERGSLQFTLPSASKQDPNSEGEGRPPNRTSGGSRGTCSQQVVALIPGEGTVQILPDNCATSSQSLLTLTVSATPTFWFYVSTKATPDLFAEFVLYEGDRFVYKQRIPLSGTPGTISFRPDRPLDTNKRYRWFFSVSTNPQRPSQNPVVAGYVRRIVPDVTLSRQLKAVDSKRGRIAIYARNGIWHEAITELGALHRANPKDSSWQADWSSLLNSVGLEAIAEIPLVDCCTPNLKPYLNSHTQKDRQN
jgi:hypothetical protein